MDYEQIVLHWVNRVSFQTRKELTSRFAAHGENISAEEWACLLILWQRGPLSPSEISDDTVRDRTTATRLIDRLVKKDLVKRIRHESDGRRLIVALTERGQNLKSVLVPIAKELINEVTKDIPEEQLQAALTTLQIISKRLSDLD